VQSQLKEKGLSTEDPSLLAKGRETEAFTRDEGALPIAVEYKNLGFARSGADGKTRKKTRGERGERKLDPGKTACKRDLGDHLFRTAKPERGVRPP